MDKFKGFLRKAFVLPLCITVIFNVASATGLIFIFTKDLSYHFLSYFIYAFSFYSLVVLCVWCVLSLPYKINEIKWRIYNNKFGNRFISDPVFRTRIFLYTSLCVNILFIALNVIYSVINSTFWFGIFAVYYAIMVVLRFMLVKYINKKPIGSDIPGEWKIVRLCGAVLTLLNLVLTGAVLMIISQGRGFVYHGLLIYIMAMYAFYTTTISVVNIIKFRKYKSPVLSATKIVALASALISMLQLETAMLTAFGTDTPQSIKNIVIAVTGALICATVFGLSAYMIIRSVKEIEKERLK